MLFHWGSVFDFIYDMCVNMCVYDRESVREKEDV